MRYGRVSIERVRSVMSPYNQRMHIRTTRKAAVREVVIVGIILRYFVGDATIKNIQEKYREPTGNNGRNGGEEP
jgi:hypothetical protein